MGKNKKKPLKQDQNTEEAKRGKKESEKIEENDFDFGGIPKHVNFKRNMGCGG